MSESEGSSRRFTHVGRALERYLDESGLSERVDEANVIPDWDDCVGEHIARATRPLRVSNGVLVVAVRSSAWIMELKMMERQILRRLDRPTLRGIRFVMDGGKQAT